MNKSKNIANISKAISLLQGEIEDLHKDKKGYGYKYADLAQCLKILRPLLEKNGLAVTQIPGCITEDRLSLETIIMHESGEWIGGAIEVPVTIGKGMIAAQAVGSTISYARRYALVSQFGLAAEDDDLSSVPRDNREVVSFKEIKAATREQIDFIKNNIYCNELPDEAHKIRESQIDNLSCDQAEALISKYMVRQKEENRK